MRQIHSFHIQPRVTVFSSLFLLWRSTGLHLAQQNGRVILQTRYHGRQRSSKINLLWEGSFRGMETGLLRWPSRHVASRFSQEVTTLEEFVLSLIFIPNFLIFLGSDYTSNTRSLKLHFSYYISCQIIPNSVFWKCLIYIGRWENDEVPDIAEFLLRPWAMITFHDKFRNFFQSISAEVREVMRNSSTSMTIFLTELATGKIKSLEPRLTKLSGEIINNKLMGFLKEHEQDLPKYRIPTKVVRVMN